MQYSDDLLKRILWPDATTPGAPADGTPPDTARVAELAQLLTDRHAAAQQQVRDDARHLAYALRILALSRDPADLPRLLRLVAQTDSSVLPYRVIASYLVQDRTVDDLAGPLFDPRDSNDRLDELRACVFQELLLRGADTEGWGPLRTWTILEPKWFALNWLPAVRYDFEDLPQWGPRYEIRSAGGGEGPPGLDRSRLVSPPVPRAVAPSPLRDSATAWTYEAVGAAARAGQWGHEERVFFSDAPITPEELPALLANLPMECVKDLGPDARFEVAAGSLAEVWRVLYTIAAHGGAYDTGKQGAYGRLAAWQSLAGLSGAGADAPADEVAQLARDTTWFRFESDAEWFHNDIGNDIGIAALSPDGRRVAVLAATNTD